VLYSLGFADHAPRHFRPVSAQSLETHPQTGPLKVLQSSSGGAKRAGF